MEIYKFDKSVGRQITQFDSNFIGMPVVNHEKLTHVGCMYLPAGGNVGKHKAVTNQLFLVVEGEGIVYGSDNVEKPIQKGEAAFWQDGEMHGVNTDSGLTAIVIEGDELIVEGRR